MFPASPCSPALPLALRHTHEARVPVTITEKLTGLASNGVFFLYLDANTWLAKSPAERERAAMANKTKMATKKKKKPTKR